MNPGPNQWVFFARIGLHEFKVMSRSWAVRILAVLCLISMGMVWTLFSEALPGSSSLQKALLGVSPDLVTGQKTLVAPVAVDEVKKILEKKMGRKLESGVSPVALLDGVAVGEDPRHPLPPALKKTLARKGVVVLEGSGPFGRRESGVLSWEEGMPGRVVLTGNLTPLHASALRETMALDQGEKDWQVSHPVPVALQTPGVRTQVVEHPGVDETRRPAALLVALMPGCLVGVFATLVFGLAWMDRVGPTMAPLLGSPLATTTFYLTPLLTRVLLVGLVSAVFFGFGVVWLPFPGSVTLPFFAVWWVMLVSLALFAGLFALAVFHVTRHPWVVWTLNGLFSLTGLGGIYLFMIFRVAFFMSGGPVAGPSAGDNEQKLWLFLHHHQSIQTPWWLLAVAFAALVASGGLVWFINHRVGPNRRFWAQC
jgi:hypothetical protein